MKLIFHAIFIYIFAVIFWAILACLLCLALTPAALQLRSGSKRMCN